MYVNAITRNEKTTNTRSCSDKALSRIAIANREDIYVLSLFVSPWTEKSENLIRLICNFVAPGVLQITYTSRELALSSGFKLEAGLKGGGDSVVTLGDPRGDV